jgi:hypothetical protein
MRAIAGAIITLAGAVLWSAGALAVTASYGVKAPGDHGGWATFGGLVLAIIGVAIVVADTPYGRPKLPTPDDLR